MTQCIEGQGFGQNYNPSYKAGGLIGHTGIDESCGWQSPIHSFYDGYCYKVRTVHNPSSDGFTEVAMIVDDGLECFEWVVGHCDPLISEGTQVKKGDCIGSEANHGTIYSGNILITLAMQAAGDQRGHHRHYQKRPVMKVAKTMPGFQYLTASDGSIFYDGNYYQVFNYNNGFNGCIDPVAPVFNRTLVMGQSGYDVFVLQRLLARKGFLTVAPTGFFGIKTATALAGYQSTNSLAPVSIFGPKTRAIALRELSQPPVISGA